MNGPATTDRELAEALRAGDVSGDVDAIIECENEICARLNIPLEATEQGLTPNAAQMIVDFCKQHGVT